MSIEEMRKKRDALEIEMAEKLRAFEIETGATIQSVSVEHHPAAIGERARFLTEVKIRVGLDV